MSQEVELHLSAMTGLPDRLREAAREAKKAALGGVGEELLSMVRQSAGTHMNAARGRVASWQRAYTGTHGGYVAVRAAADTYIYTKSGKKYAVGYVTNAVENGHRVRLPSGTAARYKPRIRTAGRVPGRYFYRDVQNQTASLEQKAKTLVEEKLKEVLEHD